MHAKAFHRWLAQAGELTPSQRRQALEWLHQERQPADVIASLLDSEPACPYCHEDSYTHWGSSRGLPRYRCSRCQKTFNALTGTPLARLRHRECWPVYAQALIEGTTVREAAPRCGIHKNTAFRWRHRFLALPAQLKPSHLHGIVEADETYFLESHKGERNLLRPPRKRGGVAAKRGLSEEQIPVLIARDRSTNTTDARRDNANTQAICTVLEPVVDPDAVLCSDGNIIYQRFAEQIHLAHKSIHLSAGIRVVDNAFHIQIAAACAFQLLGELLVLPEEMRAKQWVAMAGLDPRQHLAGSSVNQMPRCG